MLTMALFEGCVLPEVFEACVINDMATVAADCNQCAEGSQCNVAEGISKPSAASDAPAIKHPVVVATGRATTSCTSTAWDLTESLRSVGRPRATGRPNKAALEWLLAENELVESVLWQARSRSCGCGRTLRRFVGDIQDRECPPSPALRLRPRKRPDGRDEHSGVRADARRNRRQVGHAEL
jgi:hypothetical protein